MRAAVNAPRRPTDTRRSLRRVETSVRHRAWDQSRPR